jgi:PDZ domain-containing protein
MVIAEVDTVETIVSPPPVAEQGAPPSPRRRRWWLPLMIVAAVVALTIIGASLITVNYFAVAPGDAQPTEPRVQISGPRVYDSNGRVLFVTVGVPRLTALTYVMGELQDNTEVVPARQILGDQTETENRQENLRLMTYSKDFASYVALSRLGFPVTVKDGGVVVDNLCLAQAQDGTCTTQSPAASVLQKNDIITAVDSTPVNVIPDLSTALAGKKVGDTVTLAVTRNKQQLTEQTTLFDGGNGRPIIGFVPNQSPPDTTKFVFPFEVNIDSGSVGGPSAGLAFTLALLDQLTPGDLTGGVKVAATGTISPSGDVGDIGGLPQKTVAVMRTGAKVFLVPADQVADAQKAARGSDLKVVGVRTLDDALQALASLGGNAGQLGTPGASYKAG